MPASCAAWGCANRRSLGSRSRGITFHMFPKEKELRRQWEVALKRESFSASDSSVICSEHFKLEDFDRTGQTVRIRDGTKPSVFNLPTHLQRPVAIRTTQVSRKAEETLQVDSDCYADLDPEPLPNLDHTYVLPASPTALKTKLSGALVRVESLERQMRNVRARE
ncbi:THAP domain-containing protein 6-like [Diretmus argenteus]